MFALLFACGQCYNLRVCFVVYDYFVVCGFAPWGLLGILVVLAGLERGFWDLIAISLVLSFQVLLRVVTFDALSLVWIGFVIDLFILLHFGFVCLINLLFSGLRDSVIGFIIKQLVDCCFALICCICLFVGRYFGFGFVLLFDGVCCFDDYLFCLAYLIGLIGVGFVW